MANSTMHILVELSCGDDLRAEAAVAIIANLSLIEEQELINELRKMMNLKDINARWWAVRALAGFSKQSIYSLLLEGLNDIDASVRQCAALGLCFHPNSQAVNPLIKALDDTDRLAASLAADALAAIGPLSVPALIEVMSNGSQTARINAVRTLAKIGDERALPVLLAALDEDSSLMVYWANEGLTRMDLGMVYFQP